MTLHAAGLVTGLAAEARLAARLGTARAGGGGAAGAEAAARVLVEGGAWCLVSLGLAGGLDPALRPGAVLVPRAVVEAGACWPVDVALASRLGAVAGLVVATDAAAASVAAKAALRAASGAAAVDLESGAVARVAASAGLPFAVLRVICDPAERELPPAALAALDASGAIGILRVARSLAGRPAQLPALLRLAADAARARRALLGRVEHIRRGGGLVREL